VPADSRAGGLSLQQVSKGFGTTRVLEDVSLEAGSGEFLTLLGPSGCGKSTLLRIIAGLETADSGSVSIGGRAVDSLAPAERDVAMVFQTYALYPHLTVAENLAVPLQLRRLSWGQRLPLLGSLLPGVRQVSAEIARAVTDVAELLDLQALLQRRPGELSGGQRQRVALGRAIIRSPAIFLMDEPLSNLDAQLRRRLRHELVSLHRRLGRTLIYVTHDREEAMAMSDRIAVMLDGRIVQTGSPTQVYHDPAHLRVAELIATGRINVLEGVVRSDGAVESCAGVLRLSSTGAAGTRVSVCIRAEALRIGGSGQVTISGIARQVERLGSGTFVHAEVEGSAELVTGLGPDPVREGDRVRFVAEQASVLVFRKDGVRMAAGSTEEAAQRAFG
jgi:multiple sugar transport system ATP-binding protein